MGLALHIVKAISYDVSPCDGNILLLMFPCKIPERKRMAHFGIVVVILLLVVSSEMTMDLFCG